MLKLREYEEYLSRKQFSDVVGIDSRILLFLLRRIVYRQANHLYVICKLTEEQKHMTCLQVGMRQNAIFVSEIQLIKTRDYIICQYRRYKCTHHIKYTRNRVYQFTCHILLVSIVTINNCRALAYKDKKTLTIAMSCTI